MAAGSNGFEESSSISRLGLKGEIMGVFGEDEVLLLRFGWTVDRAELTVVRQGFTVDHAKPTVDRKGFILLLLIIIKLTLQRLDKPISRETQ